MKTPSSLPFQSSQQGGTLLEALIAIVIFSFGILGLIGLQANMTRAASEAKYRSEAGYIAQQHIGKMWGSQQNLTALELDKSDISQTSGLPQGTLSAKIEKTTECGNGCNRATVKVTWQQPTDDTEHNVTIIAYMTGG